MPQQLTGQKGAKHAQSRKGIGHVACRLLLAAWQAAQLNISGQLVRSASSGSGSNRRRGQAGSHR
jgi:hypothetical protein